MTTPLGVQFTDAPASTATVRLDLSQSNVRVLADGFSAGHPSYDAAPRSFGVDYGYRDGLTMRVQVDGDYNDAATVLQQLARETMRPTNWLQVQLPGATSSGAVWFKTYRGEPGDLSLDNAGPGIWEIEVPLLAEGFAYGERVNLPSFTINNDPAAGTNPCFYKLPTILGDAPAPLRIAAGFSATLNQSEIMWSVSPAPSTYTAPIVWPIGTGDGLTAGADTGAASTTGGSAYSGGSFRPVSFATTPGMATRLTGTAPSTVLSGRYQVFLRVARSDTSSTFAFKFGYTDLAGPDVNGSPTVNMDRGTSTTAGHATWVPLGVFAFPKYQNDLVVPGFDFAPGWCLQAQRLSGSGAANLDAIMLVPVDLRDYEPGRTQFSDFPGFGPQSGDICSYWDGDLEAYTRANGFAVIDSGIQPWMRGQAPMVYPGQANILHLLQQTRLKTPFFGALDNSDAISRSAVIALSYHPRYLNLRGD